MEKALKTSLSEGLFLSVWQKKGVNVPHLGPRLQQFANTAHCHRSHEWKGVTPRPRPQVIKHMTTIGSAAHASTQNGPRVQEQTQTPRTPFSCRRNKNKKEATCPLLGQHIQLIQEVPKAIKQGDGTGDSRGGQVDIKEETIIRIRMPQSRSEWKGAQR